MASSKPDMAAGAHPAGEAMKRSLALHQTAFKLSRCLFAEHELSGLLQGICDCLSGSDTVFSRSWLVLQDQEHGGVISAETGLGESAFRIMEGLRQGRLPACAGILFNTRPEQAIPCPGCPDGICFHQQTDAIQADLATLIPCREKVLGFLVVTLLGTERADEAALRLLGEMGLLIGRAIDGLIAREESQQREDGLRRIEERFELALHASRAGLWDWDIRSGEMFTSPDKSDFLDYRGSAGENTSGWQGLVHPEDRARVLEVLHGHLAGETDEYRIEYRVKGQDGQWKWFLDQGRVVERDGQNMPVRMTGTHQDITHQKVRDEELATARQRLHEAVERERRFLQNVIDSAGDPVLVIDMDYNVLLMNDALAHVMDLPEDDLGISGKCYALFHRGEEPCRDKRFPCPVDAIRSSPRRTTLVHNPLHGNRVNNTFELEVSPLVGQDGSVQGIIEVARDVTDRLRIEQELRASQSRLYRLAHHDTLTGLPNRLLFRDRLERAITKAQRNGGRVAILFLDLDRFKNINDTLGHDVGDELLVEVAKRLQRQCRKSDTVARLGGDEFVFILEDIQSTSDSATVAQKIMDSMKEPVLAGNHELYISTSIGIGIFPDDSNEVEGVIKCADTALYRAKEEGRSTFKFYSSDMDATAYRLLLLENELRRAVGEQQFFLQYQPQYAMHNRTLVGFEALVRWRHPEYGLILPEDFIPLAEESGLIIALGEWVFHEVCRQLNDWRAAGLHLLPVAVNVSARQFRERDFTATLLRIIRQSGLDPRLLEIELTEGTVMDRVEETVVELEQITRLGVRLAVDDFGTGYSSLAYLQRFPLDRLKIDRSFIRDVVTGRDVLMIVQAMITMAHSLGLTVLAEGVENEEQVKVLRENGCDQVQGFLFSLPLAAGEAALLLNKAC